MRAKHVSSLAGLICVTFCGAATDKVDYSGKYAGQQLAVDLSPAGDGYAGTIKLADQSFPCKATVAADGLHGSFVSGGHDFPFTATLAGDTLTLATGDAKYVVTRPNSQPVNPLGAKQPENPLATGKAVAAAAASDAPTVLASTDSGKALFFQRPTAATAADAIEQTMPLVARMIGGTVKVSHAFADQKQPANGGCAITVDRPNSPAIVGTVLCGGAADGHGTVVTVTYARADAPPAEGATLRAALPLPPVKVSTVNFPDGTGSIDLPAGWKTSAQTLDNGVNVTGPDGQMVGIGQGIGVQDPNGQLMQMMLQTEARSRQMGMQPMPRPPGMLVAPFGPPAEAIKTLIPQIDRMLRQANQPGLTFGRMIEVQDAQPQMPNGRAQRMHYTWTKGTTPYESVGLEESAEVGMGGWIILSTEVGAPAERFERDGPTMLAIVNSVKVNQEVMQQHFEADQRRNQQMTDQMRADQDRRFQQQQAAHQEQMKSYDRQNEAWANRSLAQSRSNADFCEVIRGYRTVEDTRTGNQGSATLGDVDHVVDKLNEADPGRYKQVPLRDEMYPAK